MHFGGRFRGKSSRANLRVPQAPKNIQNDLKLWGHVLQHSPAPPGISWGSISSCFEPHGQRVSTTSRIKLLCGIFWTLNGLSQPDEWQFVSLPYKLLEKLVESFENNFHRIPSKDYFDHWNWVDQVAVDRGLSSNHRVARVLDREPLWVRQ